MLMNPLNQLLVEQVGFFGLGYMSIPVEHPDDGLQKFVGCDG